MLKHRIEFSENRCKTLDRVCWRALVFEQARTQVNMSGVEWSAQMHGALATCRQKENATLLNMPRHPLTAHTERDIYWAPSMQDHEAIGQCLKVRFERLLALGRGE